MLLPELQVTDADGYLERTFMSPASVRAASLIRAWMEDAGLTTLASVPWCNALKIMRKTLHRFNLYILVDSRWVDYMGNVHGRVEGLNASAEALLIGSHLVILLFCIPCTNSHLSFHSFDFTVF